MQGTVYSNETAMASGNGNGDQTKAIVFVNPNPSADAIQGDPLERIIRENILTLPVPQMSSIQEPNDTLIELGAPQGNDVVFMETRIFIHAPQVTCIRHNNGNDYDQ